MNPVPLPMCCLLALLLVLGTSGCSRPSPEARLRESVATLQAAIEARDASGLRELLAEDFVGPDGLDRQGATRLAQGLFLRYRDVGLVLGPLELRMGDRHATVRFTAAARGGSGAVRPELPVSARIHTVETGWRLEDGEWHLTSARWQPVL